MLKIPAYHVAHGKDADDERERLARSRQAEIVLRPDMRLEYSPYIRIPMYKINYSRNGEYKITVRSLFHLFLHLPKSARNMRTDQNVCFIRFCLRIFPDIDTRNALNSLLT